ncbi:MAG: EamA family transporter [Paludibacter sp.]
MLSQTVFTAIFSVLLLGEILTFHEIGGAVVVLVGIYLVNRRK